jgi:hypothetical protein
MPRKMTMTIVLTIEGEFDAPSARGQLDDTLAQYKEETETEMEACTVTFEVSEVMQ